MLRLLVLLLLLEPGGAFLQVVPVCLCCNTSRLLCNSCDLEEAPSNVYLLLRRRRRRRLLCLLNRLQPLLLLLLLLLLLCWWCLKLSTAGPGALRTSCNRCRAGYPGGGWGRLLQLQHHPTH